MVYVFLVDVPRFPFFGSVVEKEPGEGALLEIAPTFGLGSVDVRISLGVGP